MTVWGREGPHQRYSNNRTRTLHDMYYVNYDDPGSVFSDESKQAIVLQR